MSNTLLIGKEATGGVAGFNWDVAGDEGAQEVPVRFAQELLLIPDAGFYVVEGKKKKPVETEEEKTAREAHEEAAKALKSEEAATKKKTAS